MPFTIIRNDITKMETDAIVNAANTALQMGGGVCGAIFAAAGARELQAACDKLAPIQTGEALITPGFNLPPNISFIPLGRFTMKAGTVKRNCSMPPMPIPLSWRQKTTASPSLSRLFPAAFSAIPKRKPLK